MKEVYRPLAEKGLDPENWDSMRFLGHRMVDDLVEYLQGVGERPAWQPVPGEVRSRLREPIPMRGESAEVVYEDFLKLIRPYPMGNIHPRFWGWVMGTGSLSGAFAEMLASGMNSNVCLGNQSAMFVEQQVISWCCDMMGYPANSSGILVSGASMANLTALTVARHEKIYKSGGRVGMLRLDQLPVLYCSTETHSCIAKAASILGFPPESVRKVAVDDQFRIRVDMLEEAIRSDIDSGNRPFCVVANAGTVNTGAIDPLAEILVLCRNYDLWFHVDGAFGASARCLPEYAELLKDTASADSLAFDLHKWFHIPYESGCVLIRDSRAHRSAFAASADYLVQQERGSSGGPDSLGNYGMELSRGFKALKVWMLFREWGLEHFASLIRQNLRQASGLARKVMDSNELELMAPVPLNIVCFRYVHPWLTNEVLNGINQEILLRLQERGIAVPSSTLIRGRFAIRVAVCNHRSRESDFEVLVAAVLGMGRELSAPFLRLMGENLDC